MKKESCDLLSCDTLIEESFIDSFPNIRKGKTLRSVYNFKHMLSKYYENKNKTNGYICVDCCVDVLKTSRYYNKLLVWKGDKPFLLVNEKDYDKIWDYVYYER